MAEGVNHLESVSDDVYGPPRPRALTPEPARRRSAGHVALVVIVILVLAVTGGAIGVAVQRWSSSKIAATRSPSNAVTTTDRSIAARVAPAVVAIDTKIGVNAEAAGTGMIISASGDVLTNNHVIADATDIRVYIGGTSTSHAAIVLGYDVADDVAVLQIDSDQRMFDQQRVARDRRARDLRRWLAEHASTRLG